MRIDPDATATIDTAVSGPAAAARVSRGGATGSTGSTRVTTPRDALRLEEIQRTRVLAGAAGIVAIVTIAAMVPLGGDPTGKLVHLLSLIPLGAYGMWVYWRLRDPEAYAPWIMTMFAVITSPPLTTAFYFWGVYSSAVLFVPIALYYVSNASIARPAQILLVLVCIPHGILGVATATGVLEDRGVVRPWLLDTYTQLAVIGIAQFAFLISYALARSARGSTLAALEELDGAVRDVAKREALLAEARHDLERALQVGGPGLYSDHTIGSFRLGNLIGRGAMGEVYEAAHVDTGQVAAVKVLQPQSGSNPALVQRFLREVEIASRLDSPHVVRVLEISPSASSLPYLAMEMLDGETLAERLRDEPRMQPARVVDMMSQLAEGVEAAHEAGIIHRDLKPRNVFLDRSGGGAPRWKILDFGVSKLADAGGTLTKGHLVGTPAYMAPEQARGQEVDPRADVYALGVIAYRVLTGRPAFSGSDVPGLLYAVAHEMPPRPTEMATLPGAVDAVLAVAIAKDREERFMTATELAGALRAAVNDQLPASLRARAEALAREHPWGKRA